MSTAITRKRELPTQITPLAHRLAIASLVSQIGIIVTGGAVRLTKSGLGCDSWPNCMPGTMTPVPEAGIHGIIEFGNRTLTFVLVAIAVATIVSVWGARKQHRTIFLLSLGLLAIIPLQAIIGGITVWTELNPWVVSLHFLASAFLVGMATLLVNRTGLASHPHPGGISGGPMDGIQRQLGWAILILSWLAVIFGTIVTGTGPHAGDAKAPRHDFNADLVTRIHVVPVYLLIAAALVALFLAYRRKAPLFLRHGLVWLLVVILVQGGIGYTQHFTGLPIWLVLSHMLGSALLMVAATNVWDRATALVPTK